MWNLLESPLTDPPWGTLEITEYSIWDSGASLWDKDAQGNPQSFWGARLNLWASMETPL